MFIDSICFDICGRTERASLLGHCVQMKLLQNFCPLCDKQVIASTLWQLGINFTCIFKVSQNYPVHFCPLAYAITYTNAEPFAINKGFLH